jgi:chemotaxis protein MotB
MRRVLHEGHTPRPYASRRELAAGGMDSDKILRVVGLSSSALFNPADPYDANNRRISIIVMNKETEESVRQHIEP